MPELVISIDPLRPRDGRTDALTGQLRSDLRRLPEVTVGGQPAPDEPGGRSSAVAEIGTLVVSGLFSVATLNGLVTVLGDFLVRSKASSVHVKRGDLEVTLTGIVTREQRDILELMIRSGTGDSGTGDSAAGDSGTGDSGTGDAAP